MCGSVQQINDQKSDEVLKRLDGQVLNVNTNDWKNPYLKIQDLTAEDVANICAVYTHPAILLALADL